MKVEIGAGTLPTEGYINLDPAHGVGDFKRRIQDGIPLPDNSVEAVRASHVLEHIPAGAERIFTFNEVYRVLVPGGTFEIIVPVVRAYGEWINSWAAWADFTHVSYWCWPESLMYVTEGPFKPNADYGINIWQALRDEDHRLQNVYEGWAILRKPL